ncbi:hypothetical protein [Streptomyces violarus]|uniref:hypothetical protein n=1 Tax=Streptomyces violarus TaxID=67380 RepID=UPI0021C06360|nr:hypothetical protein [Streptomyces violarus]MCT9141728.1 hypothetical protein [Streptomyces violarus]
MTPQRERSIVPSNSGIGGERKPLRPEVEPILRGEGEQDAGTESRTPEVPDSRTPEVPDSGDPKWRTLERKEARLRKDQLSDLADLRRYLGARRRDRSEIITDNTLIRVAVDLLLKGHAHRLHGDTEEALLQSVLPRRRAAAQQEEAS